MKTKLVFTKPKPHKLCAMLFGLRFHHGWSQQVVAEFLIVGKGNQTLGIDDRVFTSNVKVYPYLA